MCAWLIRKSSEKYKEVDSRDFGISLQRHLVILFTILFGMVGAAFISSCVYPCSSWGVEVALTAKAQTSVRLLGVGGLVNIK